MGFLDTLKQTLGSVVGGGATTQAVGIDIGSSSIKMVQLRRQEGAAVLETYGELALGVYGETDVGRAVQLPPEKLAEALTDLRKEAGVTTPVCGVGIPYRASMVSIISLPDVGATQLAKMIPIEARKYIPVPIKEVQLDWFIIPEEESRLLAMSGEEEATSGEQKAQSGGQAAVPKVDVLLAAIYRSTLEAYHKAITMAGFRPLFYEIEAFSAMRSLSEIHKAPYAIVDFGAASTKFYAVELGLVRSSHVVPRGGQDITLAISRALGVSVSKAEELKREIGLAGGGSGAAVAKAAEVALSHILTEVRHAIAAYQKRFNRALEYAVIMGGGAQLPGLEEAALQEWGLSVRRADPFAKVKAPAFLDPVLREVGPEFAVAVGLALRHVSQE